MIIREQTIYREASGRPVGPLVVLDHYAFVSGKAANRDAEWNLNGTVRIAGPEGYGDLIAEWDNPQPEPAPQEAGPVRTETVTRLVIVPGVYGRIVVSPHAASSVTHVGVALDPILESGYAALSAAELRAAARVFNSLAEALEETP